jgi:putative ABC transport system ATP-binding protein
MLEYSVGTEIVARASQATKSYGNDGNLVTALDRVSLDIEAGRLTAIMGPSGSGKSTLMHVMAGLDRLTSGHVFLGNTELTALSDDELTVLRRKQIGFIFQSFNLVPTLDILGNVALPFALDGRNPSPAELAAIMQLISDLGLGGLEGRRPSQLSGGQQQRVAIVRALASQPRLIFADEPTGNLDSRSSREVLGLLQRATREFGQSVVLVTHDPVAASYADRVVFIADGRVAHDMGPADPQFISEIVLNLEVHA